jgi:hypothetical protein
MKRGETPQGTTPLAVADEIDARADSALKAMGALTRRSTTRFMDSLDQTPGDIRRMALLGKYYAAKIRGATELAWFRATGDKRHRTLAVANLVLAADFAGQYANSMSRAYEPRIWTNRVGIVDFAEMATEARNDIGIARNAVPPAAVNPSFHGLANLNEPEGDVQALLR